MSYTAREFSHATKKWLLLLLQKYRGKTLYQSLWGEIRGIRYCRSHQIIAEGHLCRFHKNLSIVLLARWHSERWNARWNTKNTLSESVRGFIFTCSYSKPMIISPVSLKVCKAKFFVSQTLSTRHLYCLRFSLFSFRLNSSPIRPEPTFSGKMESIIPESLRGLTRWTKSPRTLGTRVTYVRIRTSVRPPIHVCQCDRYHASL